jgi:phosphosulfolactate synthase
MGTPFPMIPLPPERSTEKPRRRGITMMMDWGIPIRDLEGLLEMTGRYADLAKFVVGTARLYDEAYLVQKVELYKKYDVAPFLGGQFLEFVFATQGMPGVRPYFEEARRLGFAALEVSDNVVPLSSQDRRAIVALAVDCGLHVHGEVGSKHDETSAETLIGQANEFFQAGADVVLVEAAELLEDGEPNRELIRELANGLDVSKVLFELPGPWIKGTTTTEVIYLSKFLIDEFGADVNMANVMPDYVFQTEALRAGLSFAGPRQVNRAAE